VRSSILLLAVLLAACGDDDRSAAEQDPSLGGGGGGVGGDAGAGGTSAGGGTSSPGSCFDGAVDVQGPVAGVVTATTPHYVLVSEMPAQRSEEMARMLEASWLAFAEYFGSEPTDAGPHTLKMYADFDAWVAGLQTDGIDAPVSAGGYYDPNGGAGYLYDQPTRYFTDTLLLHEAAHQFHHLASGIRGQPFFYAEGIAELISRHHWDGSCVELGVLPLLTQEDYPAQALAEVGGGGLDLGAIVSEATIPSRPLLWAMFRYFETADAGRWAADFGNFRSEMDGGAADPLTAFTTHLGPPSDHNQPLAAWLSSEQEPMTPVYLEWQHVGPSEVIGDSDFFSIARVKAPVSHFEVSFEAPPAGGSGGVVLAYDDSDNWTGFVVHADGTASTFVSVAGSAMWWGAGTACAPACPSYQLSVDHATSGKADISINGVAFDSLDISAAPAVGLAVNAARLSFADISWR